MSVINFHTKEISVKIVYYGSGLCGKTTSLQAIYNALPEERRNQFVSLATEVDRTLFFDFLPVTAYRVRDFTVRLQLYTVPGQVFYNATRKLVLNGVDGLVFVADSQRAMLDSNLESLHNLRENLADLGMELDEIPIVIEANKRDLRDIHTLEEMDEIYNERRVPFFATVATTGEGVVEALRAVSQLVVNNLVRKGLGRQLDRDEERRLAATQPAPATDGGLSETVAAAAAAAVAVVQNAGAATETANTRSTEPIGGVGIWPERPVKVLGEEIVAAINLGHWSDAILATERLLQSEAERWAKAAGQEQLDPLPAFLLLRGVAPNRYRTMQQAAAKIRAGEPVVQSDALAGLILALQTVW